MNYWKCDENYSKNTFNSKNNDFINETPGSHRDIFHLVTLLIMRFEGVFMGKSYVLRFIQSKNFYTLKIDHFISVLQQICNLFLIWKSHVIFPQIKSLLQKNFIFRWYLRNACFSRILRQTHTVWLYKIFTARSVNFRKIVNRVQLARKKEKNTRGERKNFLPWYRYEKNWIYFGVINRT